ncbi:hypothetical protein [Clostridium sp. BNL1100]|uniref:hypothetical protein n=1 Tax=Clostridium sp. BNL1100 TaxID=755731 RepID=UPI0005A07566|nr:hypothetical protein [Clostridium sp. BNL1100]
MNKWCSQELPERMVCMQNIEIKKNIWNIFEGLSRKDTLTVLADVIEYLGDLDFVSKLVREDFEPSITAESIYCDNGYDEGAAGHIPLADVLTFVEDIMTKSSNYNISFSGFVRPETDEEMKENGHGGVDSWYTFDESVKINDLELQFETE